jgi:hypothetical protein
MSKRNRREERKINTLRKALRKGRLPSYIDLVQYLKDHKHADTTGGAIKLIKEGRVRADSHTLGVTQVQVTDDKTVDVFTRFVPASVRASIVVA